MQQPAYVNSGYARIKDDNYQTIDARCVQALIESWPIEGKIIDCCSPAGSGVVNEMQRRKRDAIGVGDAFADFSCAWIVTNPPYERPLVDEIVAECLGKLRSGRVGGIAMLLRANWDFARSRAEFMRVPWYSAQIKMRFRPWWSSERTASPIHNYVWHVWEKHEDDYPIIKYWPKDE